MSSSVILHIMQVSLGIICALPKSLLALECVSILPEKNY